MARGWLWLGDVVGVIYYAAEEELLGHLDAAADEQESLLQEVTGTEGLLAV